MNLKYYSNYKEYISNFLDITSFESALSKNDDNQEIAKKWIRDKNNWLNQVGDYLSKPRKEESPEEKSKREELAQSFTNYKNALQTMQNNLNPNVEMNAEAWDNTMQELAKANELKDKLNDYIEASGYNEIDEPGMQAAIAAINSFGRAQKYFERLANHKLSKELKDKHAEIEEGDSNIRQSIFNFAYGCEDFNLYTPKLEELSERINKVIQDDNVYLLDLLNAKEDHRIRREHYLNYDKTNCEMERLEIEMLKNKKGIEKYNQEIVESKKTIDYINDPKNKADYKAANAKKPELYKKYLDAKMFTEELNKWLKGTKGNYATSMKLFEMTHPAQPKNTNTTVKAVRERSEALDAWIKALTPEQQQNIAKPLLEANKKHIDAYNNFNKDYPNYENYVNELKKNESQQKNVARMKKVEKLSEQYQKNKEQLIKLHGNNERKFGILDRLDNISSVDLSKMSAKSFKEAEAALKKKEEAANPELKKNDVATHYYDEVLKQDDAYEKAVRNTSNKLTEYKKFVDSKIAEKNQIKSQRDAANNNANELSQRMGKYKTDNDMVIARLKQQAARMYEKFDNCKQERHSNSPEYTNIKTALEDYLSNPTKDNLEKVGRNSRAYLDAKNKEFRLTSKRSKMGAFRLQYAQDLENFSKDGILDLEQIERDGKAVEDIKAKNDNRAMGQDSLDIKLGHAHRSDKSAIMDEKFNALVKDKRQQFDGVRREGIEKLRKLANEYKNGPRQGERYIGDANLMLDNQIGNIKHNAPEELMDGKNPNILGK